MLYSLCWVWGETLNQYGLFEEENGHGGCWTDTLITARHLSPGTLAALTSLFLVGISGIRVSPPDRQTTKARLLELLFLWMQPYGSLEGLVWPHTHSPWPQSKEGRSLNLTTELTELSQDLVPPSSVVAGAMVMSYSWNPDFLNLIGGGGVQGLFVLSQVLLGKTDTSVLASWDPVRYWLSFQIRQREKWMKIYASTKRSCYW